MPPVPRLVLAGVGGSRFSGPILESNRAGGMTTRSALILSGILLGSEVLVMSSMRVECVGCVLEFEAGRIVFLTGCGATSSGGFTGIIVISNSVL